MVPARAFDTGIDDDRLAAGETRTFSVPAETALPSDATAGSVAIAANQQTAPATFVTLWPEGAARPTPSDLNAGVGRDQRNLVVVPVVGGRPQADYAAGTVHLAADALGHFR